MEENEWSTLRKMLLSKNIEDVNLAIGIIYASITVDSVDRFYKLVDNCRYIHDSNVGSEIGPQLRLRILPNKYGRDVAKKLTDLLICIDREWIQHK